MPDVRSNKYGNAHKSNIKLSGSPFITQTTV